MKKIYALFLIFIFLNSNVYAENLSVYEGKQKLKIDGTDVSVNNYIINNYNYFRIRDIASLLKGTKKNFDIIYRKDSNRIDLIKGKDYSGKERLDQRQNPILKKSNAKLFINNREILISSFNINGYNYYKFRDIASILDFYIDFDENTRYIEVTTTLGYRSKGEDYLKAPSLGYIKDKNDFYNSISKSYFKLYEIQKKVTEDLRNNGSDSSSIISLKKSIASYYDYYQRIYNSSYLKNNKNIKEKYKDFLKAYEKQMQSYNIIVKSTREVKNDSFPKDIEVYYRDTEAVKERLVEIIELIKN